MLEREEIIIEVAQFLEEKGAATLPPLVIDPVIYAKTGDQIINDNAIRILKEKIVPLATLLTPNRQEACRLLGRERIGVDDLEEAAQELLKLGPKAVVIKGADARGLPYYTRTRKAYMDRRERRLHLYDECAWYRMHLCGSYHVISWPWGFVVNSHSKSKNLYNSSDS